MRQFEKYDTFFDLGIDDKEREFRTLYCVMPDTIKKRGNLTRLVLRYLSGDYTISADEMSIIKSVLDDSYYNKPSKYNHCKICSNDFKRIILEDYNKNLKFWDICIPTVPYFPGNLMIYLKDRNVSKVENFQDLNKEQLIELKFIISSLQEFLNLKIFDGDLVGINVLFNQISKSQLCIHGHIELMIKEANDKNLGYQLLDQRNFDCTTEYINDRICFDSNILKTREGIRINMSKMSDNDTLEQLYLYEQEINGIVTKAKKIREGKIKIVTPLDLMLYNGLSPAPTNSVYLTQYRSNLYLSSVPEVVPPTIDITEIGDLSNEENMYLIKYNASAPNEKYKLIRKYSPVVRPSSKVSYSLPYGENIKVLTRKIANEFGVSL